MTHATQALGKNMYELILEQKFTTPGPTVISADFHPFVQVMNSPKHFILRRQNYGASELGTFD